MQLHAIRKYCQDNNLELHDILHAQISGMKNQDNAAIEKLLQYSGCRIVTWDLARLGRTWSSILKVVIELTDNGNEILFVSNPVLNLSGPMQKIMISMYAAWAEEDRKLIIEKTAAGIEAAKAQGRFPGRKKNSRNTRHKLDPWKDKIKSWIRIGLNHAQIRRKLVQEGMPVGYNTLCRFVDAKLGGKRN